MESYQEFSQPAESYTSRPKIASIPKKNSKSAVNQESNELFDVLKMGPLGYERYLHLLGLKQKKQKLEVKIIEGNNGKKWDAWTNQIKGTKDFLMTFYTQSTKHMDRMYSWKRKEKFYVVGVHESQHIVKPKFLNIGRYKESDTRYNYWGDHIRHVQLEFEARFEFSLLFPSLSSSKTTWLDRYQKYFQLYRSIENPSEYIKTELDQIIDKLYTKYSENKFDKDENGFSDEENDPLFVRLSELTKPPYKLGMEETSEIIQGYFLQFDERLEIYRRYINETSIDVGFEVDVENILKNKAKYLSDKDLSYLK